MTTDKANLVLLQQKPQVLTKNESEIKAYRRRWIILFIYIFYTAINSFQWIEYSIITNIVMRYYNVNSVTVDWTSIIYMALYAPLMIPASFLLDKKGLRAAALMGGLGTALGTAIKVFSIGHDRMWVVLLGQAILSASQVLIACLPPRIAAVWFKPNEISSACSLGVFGTQLGCALGFVLCPILVKNHPDVEDIGSNLRVLCWGLTVFMIPGAIAVIFYFPLQPPKPPSITQVRERSNEEKLTSKLFYDSVKVLVCNKGFMTHNIAYGINIGVFSALGTLLSQYILEYFPNADEDAGRMGLVMIVVGMLGSIIFGVFLDKTKKYKETALCIYAMSSASVVALMFALEMRSKVLVYIAIGSVGLFTNAYMPVGFELAMELTYPSSEGTTTGLLMAPSQVMGVIFALLLGKLKMLIGPFWSLGTQALLLAIGAVITIFVPNQLRRQHAFKEHKGATELMLIKNHKNNELK